MSTTFRFIANPLGPSDVISWFKELPLPPTMVQTERGWNLHFHEFGSLVYSIDSTINPQKSPVVIIFLPRVVRGVLWTVGEVHFLSTPLKQQFPKLHRISTAFSKWLSAMPCVYSNNCKENEFAYYLEGSVQNQDTPVFAFESGYSALQSGRYFVADSDNEYRLDTICKTLALRGVPCADV
ncbi:hypothetical protein [Undibacterium baiyunense]|uniref:Uncharacterized protein n=1 Tax=Undibacterium baiyunense TaxID=2828731 RepID=A0A941I4G5_9BURK|nr:hypothetical protein [Undibacterium baiyunense]MBR7747875.1 hypothetical protein [Undibacterium baiyunense]